MLDLSELYQFVTYAECGTLSAAAEILHISQPTLTRTMHHVEDSFGVPLFHRGKNRIELTDTGKVAVEQARSLLTEAEKAIQTVQTFEHNQHMITIHSCAPAPYGHCYRSALENFQIILFPQNWQIRMQSFRMFSQAMPTSAFCLSPIHIKTYFVFPISRSSSTSASRKNTHLRDNLI